MARWRDRSPITSTMAILAMGLAGLGGLAGSTGCASTKVEAGRERVHEINALTERNELVSILADDGMPLNRQAAASTLGKLGDATAVEPLIEALSDEDAGVRRDAAAALGKLGDRRATRRLSQVLLDDPVVDVQRASARALEDLADPEAVDPLIAALADDNETVVYFAYRALVKITGHTDRSRAQSEWLVAAETR